MAFELNIFQYKFKNSYETKMSQQIFIEACIQFDKCILLYWIDWFYGKS